LEETELKRKTDFYISFYEQLTLQGFQAVADATGEYLADICFKGYSIAHFTKADHIIPNPHAEIPLGAIEQLKYIARETARDFAVDTEKPYDATKQYEFSDGSYKLAEYNGMVLACGIHHLFGYLFYTFQYPNEIGQPGERGTFFAQSDAARDFAVRSGLIDAREMFSEEELSMLHANLFKARLILDSNLSADETESFDAIIEKIEEKMLKPDGPDIAGFEFDSERDAEGVEP
jgi:hypothetical protein